MYFWEQNPGRALEYAIDSAGGIQKNKTRIKTPFVIGAVIELGNTLNLLDSGCVQILDRAYKSLEELVKASCLKMPVNSGANRKLDCDVIMQIHEINRMEGMKPFETVRSAFMEGKPVYPGSNFTDKLHIEVCVRKPELIKGYFLPQPIEKYNPYLKK